MKCILIPLIISCGSIETEPATSLSVPPKEEVSEQVSILTGDLPEQEASQGPELSTEEFIEQSCGDELFAPGGESEDDTFSYNTCQILKAIIECRKTDSCHWEQGK